MRLKIIAGNLAAVLIVGLVTFAVVRGRIADEVSKEIDNRIGREATLFDRSWQLRARNLSDLVEDRSTTRQVQDVFVALDDKSRRKRAFHQVQQLAAWLGDPARGLDGRPDIVAIVDDSGKVLARDGDINMMHGVPLAQEVPAVRTAIAGRTHHDVWRNKRNGKVMQTAVAPIRGGGDSITGALLVGYDISNGVAKHEGQMLGRDIAILIDGKVYSSSLDNNASKAARDFFFGEAKAQTAASLKSGRRAGPWYAEFAGSSYVGVTGRLPGNSAVPVAYAVLGNLSEKMELASAANIALIMTFLAVLGVLGYGFVLGSSFLKPLEQIEEAVLAVINGRTDLRIEVDSQELGGLAYRINQLINVFTGVTEESDEGTLNNDGGGAWQDAAFAESSSVGQSPTAGPEPIDDPALAASLQAEDAHGYYARVYAEYAAAKQALGQDLGGMSAEKFTQRLKGNEQATAGRLGCQMVRFQVETQGKNVVLRPVMIR